MAAAAKGHPVEFRNLSGGEWQATSSPDWNWKTQEYRTTQHGVRARCYDVTSEGRDSSRFTVDMTFCSIGGPGGAPHHWRGRTLRVIVEDDDA